MTGVMTVTIKLEGNPKELLEFLADVSVKKTNMLGNRPTPEQVDRLLERLRNEDNEDAKS